jgi:hypothetical protein
MLPLADLAVNWVVILRVGIVLTVVALPCTALLWSKEFTHGIERLKARVWRILSWARLPDGLKQALTFLVSLPIVTMRLLVGFLAAAGVLFVGLSTGAGYPPHDMLSPLFTLPISSSPPPLQVVDALQVGASGLGIVALIALLLGIFDLALSRVRFLHTARRAFAQAAVMGAGSALVFGTLALIAGGPACGLVGCSVSLSRDPSGYVPLFALYGAIYGAQLGYFATPPATKPAVFEVKAALQQLVGSLIFGVVYDVFFISGGRLDTAVRLAVLTAPLFAVVGGFLPTISWLAQDETTQYPSSLAAVLLMGAYFGIVLTATVFIFTIGVP